MGIGEPKSGNKLPAKVSPSEIPQNKRLLNSKPSELGGGTGKS